MKRSKRAGLVVLAVFTAGGGGCGVSSDGEDPSGQPSPGSTEGPPVDSISVQFRNLSDGAVDTQFYVSPEPLEQLPEELIVPENLRQSGIGVGGTGILPPFSADELELSCSDALVVGTAGGELIDDNLGTVLGQGPVRFMESGFQFDCGETLVFEYTRTLAGFTVHLFQDRSGRGSGSDATSNSGETDG